MEALNGIRNFLEIVDQNWTTILVIIGLCIGIVGKVRNYIVKSDDEKVQIAKDIISKEILKLISDAEEDYTDWNKAGEVKRAQVISYIYEKYPIFEKVANQDELIKWIDDQIDGALVVLRKIMEEN